MKQVSEDNWQSEDRFDAKYVEVTDANRHALGVEVEIQIFDGTQHSVLSRENT